MKTEELLELGLSREQASKVLAMNGRDIERTKSANAQERRELAELKKGLDERDKEIAKYRELDIENLKTEARDWQERAEKAEKEGKERFDGLCVREEMQRVCRETRAKDARILEALIDREAISVQDGSVCGLTEQIANLKSEYGFLFDAEEALPCFSQKMNGVAEENDSILRKAMGI